MEEFELKALLEKIRRLPSGNEWFEFKEAKKDHAFNNIGKYFSALSNEANLKGQSYGWLIFGVNDTTRDIVGTHYRPDRSGLDSLKLEIANHTGTRLTFTEIYVLLLPEGRVIMFQIPAASQGIPTSWKGHYYGRDGESLVALNIHKIENIRSQSTMYDWSAEICEGATIENLDPEAIKKARTEYKLKNPRLIEEIDEWSDVVFLDNAKVTFEGKITRAAIILLGKEESDYFISPSVVQMTWVLKDRDFLELDYEHFGPPFILRTDELLGKIRNLRYRYMPGNTLFPIEINQYDETVLREALHNCIAHQNYEMCGRITVVENPEDLIFTNLGNFIPETIEQVIYHYSIPAFYRN